MLLYPRAEDTDSWPKRGLVTKQMRSCVDQTWPFFEGSKTASQVARWRIIETLISGLNPPGRSLSYFWRDCGNISGTLGLLCRFPSVPWAFLCSFFKAGVSEYKLQVPPMQYDKGFWWRIIVIADMTRRPHTRFLSGRFS
jgi:hypothetical protein